MVDDCCMVGGSNCIKVGSNCPFDYSKYKSKIISICHDFFNNLTEVCCMRNKVRPPKNHEILNP